MTKLGKSLSLAFSDDGMWLALVAERAVKIARVSDLSVKCTVKAKNPSHVRFEPQGMGFVIKTTSGRLSWHDLDGKTSKQLRADSGEGPAPEFVDNDRLVDAGWSGRLELIEMGSGRVTELGSFTDRVFGLHHCPKTSTWLLQHCPLPTSDTEPPGPDYFSCFRGELPQQAPRRMELGLRFVRGTALHPSGKLLALAHGAPPDTLSIVDVATAAVRASKTLASGGTGSEMTWSPDGRRLAVVEDHACRMYDEQLTLQQELALKYASAVAFAPDQRSLAVGSWEDGAIVQLVLP